MTDFLPITPNRLPNVAPSKALASKEMPGKEMASKDMKIREVAQKLEATFIAEMLKSAGFGEQENSFNGSTGEDQFASFQREALAAQMVKVGGIGLAEAFYKSMTETQNDTR
ncbi:flagellar protein FlgJ, putative [hydrothermal vent metagenome]|uniref:Flagellar protein FlgJ, putative n=1 Tax=hydrothermal vent metagenome TaxID=652676 RepID=A0A3B0RQJ9_9ZZZZ